MNAAGSRSKLLLSIDLGTSGLRVGLFDSRGRMICLEQAAYPTKNPEPGRAEQDPAVWWSGCKGALRKTVTKAVSGRLEALCVTGQAPAFVCLDGRGDPLRPALIWSDRRANRRASSLARRLGRSKLPHLLSRLSWLQQHEKKVYEATDTALEAIDYLGFRLTGQRALTDVFGRARGLRPLAEDLGLDPSRLPDRITRTGELLAGVSGPCARATGLPRGLPVISGTIDCFSAVLGCGALRKGQLCNAVGNSNCLALAWDRPLADAQGRFGPAPFPMSRKWLLAGAMSNGGNVLHWAARSFYNGKSGSLENVLDQASSISPGAGGLVALPYLQGERAPIHDSSARGVFFGVSPEHGRAHFVRAALESVVFAARHLKSAMEAAGCRIREIRATGRTAAHPLWNQIRADVLGLPVVVAANRQGALLGAAMIAGLSQGVFTSLKEAGSKMVVIEQVVKPNSANIEGYNESFRLYRRLYRHLRTDFRVLDQVRRQWQSGRGRGEPN